MSKYKQISEAKPILATVGSPGLKRSTGYVEEEFLTSLKGTLARKKFREMADNDPMIGAALYLIESLICGVSWTVKPNESGHPQAQACADFVESCFADMEQTWQEVLSEILTALVFGWCVLEPCYKIRRGRHAEPRINSMHDDGLVGWRSWSPRAQESLERWEFSDEGRVLGMWQRPPEGGPLLFVPYDRWLHFTFRGSKNNPEGRSALRSAYMSYYFANRLREIEAIGVERNVAGMPDIQVPPELLNPNATAEQKTMLNYWMDLGKKVRTDSLYCIVRPSEETPDGKKTGYKFGLVNASGRNFAETDVIIQRHERNELICFLAEMLKLGDNGVGSYSMHSDKTNNLSMSLSRVLDAIDAITNRDAIARLCHLNTFPIDAWPTREHGDIEKVSLVEWSQAVATMVNGGVLEADDAVRTEARRLIDLPPIEEPSLAEVAEETGVAEQPIEVESDAPAMPDMLTLDEAAEYLRVSRSSLMSAMRRGQLPAAKVGSGWRITRANLDKYLLGAHGEKNI